MSSVPGSVLKDKESFWTSSVSMTHTTCNTGYSHMRLYCSAHTRCQLLSALCQIDPTWATWGRQDLFGLKVSELFQSTVLGSLHSELTVRESSVVVTEGAWGRGCSPCDRREAERRNTGQGRAGYSLPQTSSLVTRFFHQVPAPNFSPSPNCTTILEAHQGFTHCLEHSSQDTIISQKTMSSAQVLGAWAYNSQTMMFISY